MASSASFGTGGILWHARGEPLVRWDQGGEPGRRRTRTRSLETTALAHATLGPFIWAAWACSVLYEVLIGRHMPPATYGAFETVVSVLAVPSVIAGVAQLAVAREAAVFALPASSWTLWALAGAGGAGVAVWILGGWLGWALHLRVPVHTWPLVGAITTAWVALSALRGLAQGRELYIPLGSSYVLENAGRLIGTWLLVPTLGYWGGLWAVLGGALLSLGVLEFWVPWQTRTGEVSPLVNLGLYALGTAVAASLPALPLVVLRERLPALELAAFAAMLLLIRAQAQVAAWLSTALYPRLIAFPGESDATFGLTAILALVLALMIAAIGSLGIRPLLVLAFRGRYLAYAPIFRLSLFTGLPLALAGLWLTRALAARDARRVLLIAASLPLMFAGLLVAAPHGLPWVVWVGALPALPLALDTLWRTRPFSGDAHLRQAG